ncbi:MAG: hypothetical protein ABFS30_00525 [Pseudomonadota bacterium]
MNSNLSSPNTWLMALLLAALLFLPVRHLIWVLSVRRAEARQQSPTDEETRHRLKRRAGLTSALLCFVFSLMYTLSLAQGRS